VRGAGPRGPISWCRIRSIRAGGRPSSCIPTLQEADYDEIILSTLPRAVSRWLHIDLPSRVAHLGVPLTTVVAQEGTTAGAPWV
jgi:hypothetical protein